MAQPTPPPTTQTRFLPSDVGGLAQGAYKVVDVVALLQRRPAALVVKPTFWKIMVTVPFSRS